MLWLDEITECLGWAQVWRNIATLGFSQGVHPKQVQELLGHSSISLTLDTYSHLLPTVQDQVAATMERLLATT